MFVSYCPYLPFCSDGFLFFQLWFPLRALLTQTFGIPMGEEFSFIKRYAHVSALHSSCVYVSNVTLVLCSVLRNLFKHQILENSRDACIFSWLSMAKFLVVLVWVFI
jgi:hypothetical protein